MNITVANRTREEWCLAHAQASVWYVVLVMMVGVPVQIAGIASGKVIVVVALVGYGLMTAYFINQIFGQEGDG